MILRGHSWLCSKIIACSALGIDHRPCSEHIVGAEEQSVGSCTKGKHRKPCTVSPQNKNGKTLHFLPIDLFLFPTVSFRFWGVNFRVPSFPCWPSPVPLLPFHCSLSSSPQESLGELQHLNLYVSTELVMLLISQVVSSFLSVSLKTCHLTPNRESQPLRRIFHQLMGDSLTYGILVQLCTIYNLVLSATMCNVLIHFVFYQTKHLVFISNVTCISIRLMCCMS